MPRTAAAERRRNTMKATGIVRRIDDYVIIGDKSESLENTGVSLILSNFCAPDNRRHEGLR